MFTQPHFTEDKAEAQRQEITCYTSLYMAEFGFKPAESGSRVQVENYISFHYLVTRRNMKYFQRLEKRHNSEAVIMSYTDRE